MMIRWKRRPNSWGGGGFHRPIAILLCLAQVLVLSTTRVGPVAAQSAEKALSVDELMDLVDAMKARLAYGQVRNLLNVIVMDPAQDQAVLRHAFCELIFLNRSQEDEPAAIVAAREALGRFPDLEPDSADFPPYVAAICDSLRAEMFGSLAISDPPGCRVFLGGELCGPTPLFVEYIPVGSVELLVTAPGYRDYRRTIEIEAGRVWSQLVTLEKLRGTGWWLTRIGIGAVAVAGAILAFSGSDDLPEVTPLGEPPDPPATAGGL